MSETKEILTPDYWENEEFQPLVESETVYGHKVKIPQRWQHTWDWIKEYDLPLQVQVGLLRMTFEQRGQLAQDLASVMLEIYQPEPIDLQTPPDEN